MTFSQSLTLVTNIDSHVCSLFFHFLPLSFPFSFLFVCTPPFYIQSSRSVCSGSKPSTTLTNKPPLFQLTILFPAHQPDATIHSYEFAYLDSCRYFSYCCKLKHDSISFLSSKTKWLHIFILLNKTEQNSHISYFSVIFTSSFFSRNCICW